ncbi:MAG: hypothetical protein WAZ18_06895 [Alphaproteobacteria bacterium]
MGYMKPEDALLLAQLMEFVAGTPTADFLNWHMTLTEAGQPQVTCQDLSPLDCKTQVLNASMLLASRTALGVEMPHVRLMNRLIVPAIDEILRKDPGQRKYLRELCDMKIGADAAAAEKLNIQQAGRLDMCQEVFPKG